MLFAIDAKTTLSIISFVSSLAIKSKCINNTAITSLFLLDHNHGKHIKLHHI